MKKKMPKICLVACSCMWSALLPAQSAALSLDATAIPDAPARVVSKGDVNVSFSGNRATALFSKFNKAAGVTIGGGFDYLELANKKTAPADDPLAAETIQSAGLVGAIQGPIGSPSSILSMGLRLHLFSANISRTGNTPKEQSYYGAGGSLGLGLALPMSVAPYVTCDYNYDSYLEGKQKSPLVEGVLRPFEMVYPSVTAGFRFTF